MLQHIWLKCGPSPTHFSCIGLDDCSRSEATVTLTTRAGAHSRQSAFVTCCLQLSSLHNRMEAAAIGLDLATAPLTCCCVHCCMPVPACPHHGSGSWAGQVSPSSSLDMPACLLAAESAQRVSPGVCSCRACLPTCGRIARSWTARQPSTMLRGRSTWGTRPLPRRPASGARGTTPTRRTSCSRTWCTRR